MLISSAQSAVVDVMFLTFSHSWFLFPPPAAGPDVITILSQLLILVTSWQEWCISCLVLFHDELIYWGLLNSSPAIVIRIKCFPKSSRHDEIEYSKLNTGKKYRTFTVLPTLIIMFNKPIQETFFTSLDLKISSCLIINKYAFNCWAVVFTFFITHVTLMNNLSIQNVANRLKLVTNYPFIFVWVNL